MWHGRWALLVCVAAQKALDGLLQETKEEEVVKEEDVTMNIGSGVIFVAGMTMLGIIGYIVYRQHKRSVVREDDNQLMKSLLDSEMDYAAM
ncbi:hypothetical protein THRCLA_21419 [Thraustotheca clavata]|uniref:Uncharacterized protein n=1 Tax=Thraustotheca clavata TaxID=74557 RepID=A0A1V9ZWN4_9STRA|nr:hypothetical protein THRCLA_21419 [Thraustotheca clavata]